jgi:SAM-dependent methyltransferase
MRLFSFRRQPQVADETSSRRWAWLGGRRILTTTPYVLPKDKAEGDRLDLQHHLLKMAAGGLYRAPIRQPRSILDVACGTGIWGREMASEFPRARVIAFDIDRTPMEASLARLGPGGQFPQNFRFLEADAFKRFPFEDGEFDFVHGRMMSPFIPQAQWPHVIAEMLRVLRPGGYIELVDMERTPLAHSEAYYTIERAVAKIMAGRGLYVGVGDELMGHLQRAGIKRVQQRKFVLGNGRQRQREQRLLAADVLAIQENIGPLLVKAGAFTQPQFDALYQQAKEEVMRTGILMPVVFAFGAKL